MSSPPPARLLQASARIGGPLRSLAPFLAPLLLGAAPVPPTAAELVSKIVDNRSIPAMGIVIIRHGRIADEAVEGVRASDNPVPGSRSDLWHLGSDEKAMTATMIARLVERKSLSWHAPLERL